MITVEKALEALQKNIFPTEYKETKNVLDVCNFVLFEDVLSPINMPPFNQSAMDGYAVSIHKSETYTVIDEVKAGDSHHPVLKTGEAVRIFTGAAVPESANSVIMQEKTKVDGNILTVDVGLKLNDNIRPLGEQIEEGQVALQIFGCKALLF